jgi:DNA-binding transcriptional MerR regulator
VTTPMSREPRCVPKEPLAPMQINDNSLASRLQQQGMPLKEIVAVLGATDFDVVHRYMELHVERLEERLAEQRRTLAVIENLLLELMRNGTEAPAGSDRQRSQRPRG